MAAEYFADYLQGKSSVCCLKPVKGRRYTRTHTVRLQLPEEQYNALRNLAMDHGASIDEAVKFGLQPLLAELCPDVIPMIPPGEELESREVIPMVAAPPFPPPQTGDDWTWNGSNWVRGASHLTPGTPLRGYTPDHGQAAESVENNTGLPTNTTSTLPQEDEPGAGE
jgi:hypothetical protein